MNLGQLIGELQLRMSDAQLERAQSPEERAVRGGRDAAVMKLIARDGQCSCAGVAQALGITTTYASVLLLTMLKAGKLRREGSRNLYRYFAVGEK